MQSRGNALGSNCKSNYFKKTNKCCWKCFVLPETTGELHRALKWATEQECPVACRDVSGLSKGRSSLLSAADREHLSCTHCWALQKHLESTKYCSHLWAGQENTGWLGRMGHRLKWCVSQAQSKERPVGYTLGYQVLY